MDYESEEARRFGGINRWHHLECFVKLREDLEFFSPASTLNGFLSLKTEDRENIKKLLPILIAKDKAIKLVIFFHFVSLIAIYLFRFYYCPIVWILLIMDPVL